MPRQVFILPTENDNRLLSCNVDQRRRRKSLVQQLATIDESRMMLRINAPERHIDSFSDYEEDEKPIVRRSNSSQRRRKKFVRILEDQFSFAALTALVSAPIVKPPNHRRMSPNVDPNRNESLDSNDIPGQTLLHLAARLGHEEILRVLIGEISHINALVNARGQTPVLAAIESGATAAVTFLMVQDPLSLTCQDYNGSSVFHYAAQTCNDVVLNRAISLLKRFNSSTARFIALKRLVEKNDQGKTPFVIAIENDSLTCIKPILTSRWIDRHVDIGDFINADSLKTTIDNDRLNIANFFVSDMRRVSAIIEIQIQGNDRTYNVLEYSIALKKPEFVRIFISIRIPGNERELYRSYKHFLKHYNLPYSGSNYYQTPIQRMLTMSEMVPLVPLLLEQFVGENGVDLSIVDDCLRATPTAHRCLFGHSKRFSSSDWLKQHPLSLIAEANHSPVCDHDVVRLCVDLKFQLFGSFLYIVILCTQIFFVCLYTGVALISPIPPQSYYDIGNQSCSQLCHSLRLDPIHPLLNHPFIRFLRLFLLLFSMIALLKEIFQLISQRTKYFRDMFMNFLEVQTYICAILFAVDLDSCTRQTGLRCKWQWESGALGIASVWTLLLSVFMNSLKIGKYGLLFVNVFLTFMKFCLIYVLIWIGYIIAFHMLFINKKSQFTSILYAIPKTLAMLTGEYDFDDLFFPNGKFLQGSEAAIIVFSIFVFTMNIVVMNIMVGLAVSDVKLFRLNARREHLRARIEKSLVLQAKFGLLCEICSRLALALSRRSYIPHFRWSNFQSYNLWRLEIRTISIESPILTNDRPVSSNRVSRRSIRNEIICETGFYRDHIDRVGHPLFEESDQKCLMRKTEELRDCFEKANTRIYQELRRLIISFQGELDDIKRKLAVT